MPTYTHITVYEAPDDEAAKELFRQSLAHFEDNVLVDEQLRDADGNVIDHRV